MKEVWILTLKSIQRDQDEKSTSELITEARYHMDENGDRVISYDESETTGMEGSRMELRISPDNMVSVIRTGTFQTHLVVQPGRKHFCHYETPFGEIPVGVAARWVRAALTDEGGHLEMRYTVDTNSTLLSDNEIILDIRRDSNQEE
ncbi:MAG: DUF1934 domain-containing protein [Oscillospiraceae bacterium]|nr:DUF1934 domain-containing protein [Ruminococcus sp.]MBQ7003649.1 DUF1934 domain-containing protein [Oscillospiraceae bacterium]MBQ7013961.1 DUF1934 domain-containing protein [Oscillospiraceae bacterium]